MKAERRQVTVFLPMWWAFWPLGALAASWHYLPRVDGTVYGLRDDRHAPIFYVVQVSRGGGQSGDGGIGLGTAGGAYAQNPYAIALWFWQKCHHVASEYLEKQK